MASTATSHKAASGSGDQQFVVYLGVKDTVSGAYFPKVIKIEVNKLYLESLAAAHETALGAVTITNILDAAFGHDDDITA